MKTTWIIISVALMTFACSKKDGDDTGNSVNETAKKTTPIGDQNPKTPKTTPDDKPLTIGDQRPDPAGPDAPDIDPAADLATVEDFEEEAVNEIDDKNLEGELAKLEEEIGE